MNQLNALSNRVEYYGRGLHVEVDRRSSRIYRSDRSRIDRSAPPRTRDHRHAYRLCPALDGLWFARQGRPRRANRPRRDCRMVAASGARLYQASAARRMAGVRLVHDISGGRVVFLSFQHGLYVAGLWLAWRLFGYYLDA